MITKKLLGYITIDSGQVLIIDPCYLGNWKDGEMDSHDNNDYKKTCDLSLSKNKGGEIVVSPPAGKGVVSTTYDGDGVYAVYKEFDEDDKSQLPLRLIIELT